MQFSGKIPSFFIKRILCKQATITMMAGKTQYNFAMNASPSALLQITQKPISWHKKILATLNVSRQALTPTSNLHKADRRAAVINPALHKTTATEGEPHTLLPVLFSLMQVGTLTYSNTNTFFVFKGIRLSTVIFFNQKTNNPSIN